MPSLDRTARIALGLLTLVAVFSLLMVVLATCDARRDAQRAKAGETFANGRTAAASDASAIRDGADARQSETTSITKEAADEIRNAPDRPAADLATRRRVCQLSDYRGADCAMYRPDPRRVD